LVSNLARARSTFSELDIHSRWAGLAAGLGFASFLLAGADIVERRIEIRTRFLDQACAKLLAQGAALDLDHVALANIAELERAERGADEPVHVEPEMRSADALDFAVLALAQRDGQPGIATLLACPAWPRWRPY
jgi:hypothetical protein